MQNEKYTNELIHETSPYLLQHAHNPVNWQPWGEKALNQAKSENKLLLISIGYSACHWCHVMEHESFEDTDVAHVMNQHFVCIKIDREERPDIDHIYMTAVQLLTGRGGWPLNCITLPDGRPIWGGTYFLKDSWVEALNAVSVFYAENPEKTEEYAAKLHRGIEQNSLTSVSNSQTNSDSLLLPALLSKWGNQFDTKNSGTKGAPKFMLPNNWQFLLRAGHQFQDKKISDQVKLTLQKMAFGGLYDQIGGGFARYSTDEIWKVPHFEKMLYDNAQLLGLYANAFKTEPNPTYKQVIEETIEFMKRELLSSEAGFYSALDADSEGEEGKFYVWTKPELELILKNDFALFSEYFNVNSLGFWEHNQYILLRTEENASFAASHQLQEEELEAKLRNWKSLLLAEREKRIRPGLDDKILASWNAMTITGLLGCYNALGKDEYLQLALENAMFLKSKMIGTDGRLLHSFKNNRAKINGFLEDYAFVIEAFTAIFECTGEKNWLDEAARLTKITLTEFFDNEKNVFSFTSNDQKDLITRTYEIHDNVIPASNSVMAKNLFRLSYLLDRPDYRKISREMLDLVSGNMVDYPSGYSNWSQLMLDMTGTHFEVAIIGENALNLLKVLQVNYLPQVVFCAGTSENDLPLLANRFVAGKTLIYICQDNSCQLPVETVEEALALIMKK
ncbi:MAG: thioredoxin domain-containing protein [Bacteroidota bacterium]|nr:thioredoxin domain-containing protein [Bacteroidota bacterium]